MTRLTPYHTVVVKLQKMRKISIAIPVYNEQKSLSELFERLTKICMHLKQYQWEFLLIDNHSTDDSSALCAKQCEINSCWKYVRFSRNFGIESSFYAGAYYATGDALIYLFSDLQDPPEKIPEMVQHWEQGYDVVYGVLKKRADKSPLKSMGAFFAYRLLFYLSDIRLPVNATDYRLLSRPVVDFLVHSKEKTRYMRGLTHWSGFRQKSFEFTRTKRKHGESSAGLWFCIKYALSSSLMFSSKPIKLLSMLGISMTALSILGSCTYIVHLLLSMYGYNYITPPPPGWTTLVLLLFFFGGIQTLFLGVLGEYISQIHKEVKARPIFIPMKTVGVENIQLRSTTHSSANL